MKRPTAIAIVAALCSGIFAYAAWCARPFYCKPLLEMPPFVPPDAATAILEWHSEETDFDCVVFTPELFFRYLCLPWTEHRRTLAVQEPRQISGIETVDLLDLKHLKEQAVATVGVLDSVESSVENVPREFEAASMPYTEIAVTDGPRMWHFTKTFGEIRWQLRADRPPEH